MNPLSGPNKRDSRGRFGPGNPGGPGNPLGGQVARLRSALVQAVTPEDISAIAATLIELAKSGDVRAIRELLDRVLGRPVEADLVERLEQLEGLLTERVGR